MSEFPLSRFGTPVCVKFYLKKRFINTQTEREKKETEREREILSHSNSFFSYLIHSDVATSEKRESSMKQISGTESSVQPTIFSSLSFFLFLSTSLDCSFFLYSLHTVLDSFFSFSHSHLSFILVSILTFLPLSLSIPRRFFSLSLF